MIIDKIMDFFNQEDKLMVEDGGQKVDLFASEPKTWDISHETFTNVGGSGDNNIDLFLRKSQSIASDIPESYKEATRISVDELEVSGKSSGQNISTLIDGLSSDLGGETLLEGATKDGKQYSFLLDHYVDENTGEEIYKINGDRFDEYNYKTIIKNVHEKLNNVSLAASEKLEDDDGGGLSAREYLSAAEQEPKATVGKPFGSYWQPPPPK
jgi:hypothetical protein|tara:strand:+ start:697 stop:1329 length:633 start_codon:yes stop_codon:yes gene_type:complete